MIGTIFVEEKILLIYILGIQYHGRPQGGQEGALAPPLEIKKYGGPHKDNLTRKN